MQHRGDRRHRKNESKKGFSQTNDCFSGPIPGDHNWPTDDDDDDTVWCISFNVAETERELKSTWQKEEEEEEALFGSDVQLDERQSVQTGRAFDHKTRLE